MNNQFTAYAPIIIAVIAYLLQFRIFITPEQMMNTLDNKLKLYVLKESHNTEIQAIKQDVSELKKGISEIDEKITKIYEILVERAKQ